MTKLLGRLGALAAGALAMYYLDPENGRQRRAALADLVRSGMRPAEGGEATPSPGRVRRRAYHHVPKADAQSDVQLRDNIRARLGRLVSHPGGIEVSVQDGVVRLSGHVLRKERDGLLDQVHAMPGVQKLVNAMTAHDHPGGLGSLEAQREATQGA